MATTYTPGGWNWQLPQSGFQRGQPVARGTAPPQLLSGMVSTTGLPGAPSVSSTGRWTVAGTPAVDYWQAYPGMSEGVQSPIFNMYDPKLYTNTPLWNAANRYLTSWYVPQQQMAQDAYQWQNEYNEAMRRWDETFGQQDLMNRFGMDLQTRQQQMAEWEAAEAARQWAEQFGWTQTTDQWSKALAEQELAQRELLQQMQNEAALQQARVAAFGRAEQPNARYRRNWG